jgi:hypothetical protein
MIKTLMITLLVLGLVVSSAFSNEPSDEGPTVIIVGPERDGQETSYDQQPENDQYLIQENDQGEGSPDAADGEGEVQDQQEMPVDEQQNMQEYQQEMPVDEQQNMQEYQQEMESSE